MDDDHGTKEMRLGLPVKLFLNTRVVHEDERALLKVVIMDGRGEHLMNSAADCFLAFKTLADISRRSSGCFCNCWARCTMRSSVKDGTSRGGRRYVASAM